MILRALHPTRDRHWYKVAWQWKRDYPRRVKQWDGLKHFRQWFRLQQRRVSVGVWWDGRLVALVTLQLCGSDTYEVHVDCERRVDRSTLITALLSIERTVFEDWQAREVFAGVISRNGGILAIAAECGYLPDGISEQVGRLRYVRLRKTIVEYQNEHFHHQEPLPADAGSIVPGHRHLAVLGV
jgi:hypothetical protein